MPQLTRNKHYISIRIRCSLRFTYIYTTRIYLDAQYHFDGMLMFHWLKWIHKNKTWMANYRNSFSLVRKFWNICNDVDLNSYSFKAFYSASSRKIIHFSWNEKIHYVNWGHSIIHRNFSPVCHLDLFCYISPLLFMGYFLVFVMGVWCWRALYV